MSKQKDHKLWRNVLASTAVNDYQVQVHHGRNVSANNFRNESILDLAVSVRSNSIFGNLDLSLLCEAKMS
jgi:hypothetical protein